MRYAYRKSFDRAFRKLTAAEQLQAESSLSRLFDFLERKSSLMSGLGLKPIGKNYWEIRAGIKIRILFEMEKDLITFYFAGNHDEIRKFIRS